MDIFNPGNLIGNDQDNTNKELAKEFTKQLFQAKTYTDVSVRSELDKKEIMTISMLNMINKKMKFKAIDNWIIDLLRLRYSLNRKSRKEFIQSSNNIFTSFLQNQNNGINEQQQQQNLINRNV